MRSKRCEASPDLPTKLRLFADAAGFCQKPDCNRPLFTEYGVHIAEIAHIFAAENRGPRPNAEMAKRERGSYQNLILLCPSCHSNVDKAPDEFPATQLLEWKRKHKEKIAIIFGLKEWGNRKAVRNEIEPLLAENRTIHVEYGPNNEYRFDPESEQATIWQRKVLSRLMPNNRKILAILDANREQLNDEERDTLEQFRQHIDDLQARHSGDATAIGRLFPERMQTILTEEGIASNGRGMDR